VVLKKHVDSYLEQSLEPKPRHLGAANNMYKKNRQRREIEKTIFPQVVVPSSQNKQ